MRFLVHFGSFESFKVEEKNDEPKFGQVFSTRMGEASGNFCRFFWGVLDQIFDPPPTDCYGLRFHMLDKEG